MAIPPGSLQISYDFSDPACYPGSGSTVFDLVGSVDLTITNVTFVNNGNASRFHFNGLDSYLSATGVAAIGSVFTVNFWGKYIQGANSFQKTFSAGRLNSTGQGPLVIFDYGSAGTVGATMNYNGKGTVIAGGIASQEWYFISYVLDGTTAKLYVNGVLAGSDAQDSTSWLSGAFAMGARVNSTGSAIVTGDFFEGDIALLNVYDSALSAGDITTLYNDTKGRFNLYFALDAADPASYPGSGSTWTDTINNVPVTLSSTSFVSDFGGALTFPSTATGSFPVNANFPLTNDPVTINMWIKFNALPGSFQDPLFVIGNPSFNDCHYLFLLPDGALGFSGNIVYDMAGPLRADYGPLYSVDNKYHQLTTTYDGATMKSYWDGQFIPNSNFSNVGALTAYSTGYIGFFNGNSTHASFTISQLELYNNGFSALEVEQLYSIQRLRYENIVASYDFSNTACYPGSGSTVFDLSESNLDLPIINATFGGTGQSKYFDFNGTNALIGKNGVTGLGVTFSVSMWAQYPSSATSLIFPFSAGTYVASDGAGPAFGINETTANNAIFVFNDNIGTLNFATTPDVWHNYTFTNDGTTTKAYKDGVLAASVAQGIGSWDTGGLYLGVPISSSGAYYPGFYFDGQIATFDVYNKTLSAGDVTNIYNETENRFAPPPPPPYQGIAGGRQFAQGFNG